MDTTGSLRKLFEAALALPDNERTAFLDAQCRDAAQREAIERLLAADADAGEVPLATAQAIADAIGDPLPNGPLPPGTTVGPFTLGEVLGEGGSSTVFQAWREVDGVRQQVALKLLRHGLGDPDAQRQFRREQRALAQLNHPGIAHLIEGGVTADGGAYIALEPIDGKPITTYAVDHGLALDARLALFESVCAAVQAAHRALIVHRDLKPSNVLVTAEGDVKLLDFGIAKLLEHDAASTQTLHRVFTPAYAAPEQRTGELVTTATDVYALGLLLRELLTGKRAEAAAGERVRPFAVPRSGNELANIIAKACDDDPERRYASAGALADDIARLRRGQPVSAHPPSRWYRTRKFVVRHRGGVAVTVATAIALVVALGIALWQTRVARHEAAVARHEAHRADTTRAFVEHLFDPLRYGATQGHQPSLAQLLATSIANLHHDHTLDAGSRVALLSMYSRVEENLGELETSKRLADQAVALASSSLAADDIDRIRALTARGYIAERTAHHAAARHDLERAYEALHRRGIHGEAIIDVVGPLAAVEDLSNNDARALALAREGLAERIATFGKADPRVGVGYNNIASVLEGMGRYATAIRAWQRTYDFYLEHVGAANDSTTLALSGLASANYRAGHWRAAHDQLATVITAYAKNGHKPQLTEVYAADKMCFIDGLLAHAEHAAARCRQARTMTAATFGTGSDLYADALEVSAVAMLETGDLKRADRGLKQARAIYAPTPTNRYRRGRVDSYRAAIALAQGDAARARDLLLPSIAMLETRGFTTPPLLAKARLLLACTAAPAPTCPAHLQSDVERALAEASSGDDPRLLMIRVALARVELGDGETTKAARRLSQAVAEAHDLGDDHPRMLEAKLWLATADARAGQCKVAQQMADAAAADARASGRDGHPLLGPARQAWQAARALCTHAPGPPPLGGES